MQKIGQVFEGTTDMFLRKRLYVLEVLQSRFWKQRVLQIPRATAWQQLKPTVEHIIDVQLLGLTVIYGFHLLFGPLTDRAPYGGLELNKCRAFTFHVLTLYYLC
jgi:hypothetical protein